MVPLNVPVIRYAKTEQDMTAIHQFLLQYAKPALRCEVDFVKSLREVMRVCSENVGIMCFVNGELVGTFGVIDATWWYGDGTFLTDRWDFTKPEFYNRGIGDLMLDEAKKIADAAGIELIHQGKIRGEKRGVPRMMPRVHLPESA